MESKRKFRNHFSVLLEDIGRVGWFIVAAAVMGILESLMDAEVEVEEAETLVELETGDVLIGMAILIGVALLIVIPIVWRILVWSKTWITIDEQAIVIECNTILRQRKNTIAIKNISNINLEQNLFEMLIGTCKLKLDTNSMSTADSTDVKLVLKKKHAGEVQNYLLSRMHQLNEEDIPGQGEAVQQDNPGQSEAVQPAPAQKAVACAKAETGDIIRHGFLNISIFGSVFSVGILAFLLTVGLLLPEDASDEMVGMSLVTILWIAGMIFSFIWKIIKSFIRYLEFTIRRQGDRLMLDYGVMKKVSYSIPVDKIQAIRFKQTFLARVFKYYTAEVINVGMNDGDAEEQSFLLPYYKREKVEEILRLLLPEFADCMELREQRQPKSIWLIWLWPAFVYLLLMAVFAGVAAEFAADMFPVVIVAILALGGLLALYKLGTYLTNGSHMEGKFLMLVSGCMAREYLFVKYDKIQHITLKQSFLAKRCGLVKGNIWLLASTLNRIHAIPYFKAEKTELLKERIL